MSCKDAVRNILTEYNLTYKMQMPPECCGVHSDNRAGQGLIPADVHELLGMLVAGGWSWSEVQGALALELAPRESKLGQRHLKSNVQLCEQSAGLLPPISPDAIRIISLACGHTTAALRCVKEGAVATDDSRVIADENGKLSLARLADRQPAMARACEVGLTWTIIRWQIEPLCPEVANIIQSTENVGHSAARLETEWQIMFYIHAEACKMDPIDWKRVIRVVSSSKPAFRDRVPQLAEFVRVWSGGADACILREVDSFIKTLNFRRTVKPDTFQAFAAVDLLAAPLYIQACVKTLYNAPPRFCQGGGESRVLTTADMSLMTGRLKPLVMQAAKMMKDARDMLANHAPDLTPQDWTTLVGEFDCDLVMHVHQKVKSFNTITDVATAFAEKIEANLGRKISRPKGWASAADSADSSSVAAASRMREVSGHAVDHDVELGRRGFSVDAYVKDKNGVQSVIVAVGSKITLKKDGKQTKIKAAEFLTQYTLMKAADKVQDYNNDDDHDDDDDDYQELDCDTSPTETLFAIAELHKSRVQIALHTAFEQLNPDNSLFKFIMKPRAVHALANYKVKQLVLVPLSNVFHAESSKVSATAIKCEHGFSHGGKTFSIYITERTSAREGNASMSDVAALRKQSDQFVSPYFFVRSVNDPTEANVERTTINVSISSLVRGHDAVSSTIAVPIMRNIKAIKEDDELIIYKPLRATAAPPLKKPRH